LPYSLILIFAFKFFPSVHHLLKTLSLYRVLKSIYVRKGGHQIPPSTAFGYYVADAGIIAREQTADVTAAAHDGRHDRRVASVHDGKSG
jgi:hypothetical protein